MRLVVILFSFCGLLSCAENKETNSDSTPSFTQFRKDTLSFWFRIGSPTNTSDCKMKYDSVSRTVTIHMALPMDTSVEAVADMVSDFNGSGKGSFKIEDSVIILHKLKYGQDENRLHDDTVMEWEKLAAGSIHVDTPHYAGILIEYRHNVPEDSLTTRIHIYDTQLLFSQVNTVARSLGTSSWSYRNDAVTIPIPGQYKDPGNIISYIVSSLLKTGVLCKVQEIEKP